MKLFSLYCLGLCSLSFTPVIAQEVKTSDRPASVTKQSGNIRLVFANTDVSDVLQALSLKTKVNIVFPSQAKKPISVDFSTNKIEEALGYITAAAGMAYKKVDKTYIVAPQAELRTAVEPFGTRSTVPMPDLAPDEAIKLLQGILPALTVRSTGKSLLLIGTVEDIAEARRVLSEQGGSPKGKEEVLTEVLNVKNASAVQIAKALQGLGGGLKADGIGTEAKPGGSIILIGTKSQIENAKSMVQTIDSSLTTVAPDKVIRLYQIKHSSAGQLIEFLKTISPSVAAVAGPEPHAPTAPAFNPLSNTNSTGGSVGSSGAGGSATAGAATGAGGAAGKEGDRAKVIVLSGLAENVNEAIKLLQEVDVAPKQVLVEVKVVDTSPENAERIGLQYGFNPMTYAEVPFGTPIASAATVTRPAGVGHFTRTPFTFTQALSAMVTRKEVRILASPKIRVIDNLDANIFIGDTIRTRISQVNANGQTVQVVEFPIGIILLVRPRINGDNHITMRVHPVVSTISSIAADGLPQTSQREAETTVLVRNGETIVLGGLIRDEMTKTVEEIPFLSRLPIVGTLFQFRNKQRRVSEILVFITPYIVSDVEEMMTPEEIKDKTHFNGDMLGKSKADKGNKK